MHLICQTSHRQAPPLGDFTLSGIWVAAYKRFHLIMKIIIILPKENK